MITNNKAFTLTELIVTIAVMIVLVVTWAFYGRGHVKFAMMNEGRLFVDKIVAQEKNYLSENGVYRTENNYTVFSPLLYIDTRENKYFSSFRITTSGNNVTIFLRSVNVNNADAIVATYLGANDTVTFTENIDRLQ